MRVVIVVQTVNIVAVVDILVLDLFQVKIVKALNQLVHNNLLTITYTFILTLIHILCNSISSKLAAYGILISFAVL